MASKVINARLISRHDTKENWDTSLDFIPEDGEIIIYTSEDNAPPVVKVGNGVTTIRDLLSITEDYCKKTEVRGIVGSNMIHNEAAQLTEEQIDYIMGPEEEREIVPSITFIKTPSIQGTNGQLLATNGNNEYFWSNGLEHSSDELYSETLSEAKKILIENLSAEYVYGVIQLPDAVQGEYTINFYSGETVVGQLHHTALSTSVTNGTAPGFSFEVEKKNGFWRVNSTEPQADITNSFGQIKSESGLTYSFISSSNYQYITKIAQADSDSNNFSEGTIITLYGY